MGNNRYNQRGDKIPDYTPKEERKKVEEPTVALLPCCVCGEVITTGYYGRHGDSGTCSKKCENAFVKPSIIDNWRTI
jgi:hypothetical protein